MHDVAVVILVVWIAFWVSWLAAASGVRSRQRGAVMADPFPETYPAHKRSTKMLVPFVL